MSYMYKPQALKKVEPAKKPAAATTATPAAANKAATPTPAKPAQTTTPAATAAKPAAPQKNQPVANGGATTAAAAKPTPATPASTETKATANNSTVIAAPAATTATTRKSFSAANDTTKPPADAKPAQQQQPAKPKENVEEKTKRQRPTTPAVEANNNDKTKAAATNDTTKKDTKSDTTKIDTKADTKKDAKVAAKPAVVTDNKPKFRYDYHKIFDAREYRQTYLNYSDATTAEEQLNGEYNIYGFIIRTQHEFLKEINKTITKVEKKKKDEIIMLDIGTGPSIVPACFGTLFDIGTVVCTDFTPACRTLLQLWWWGREETFDWLPITKFISTLKASEKKPVEDPLLFEERARLKLQAIFSCDVEQSNVLAPNQLEQCDILTSCFTFERASSEVEDYEAIIERCNNSIRLNGYIVFAGALNQTWYKTSPDSPYKFRVQPVTEEDIKRGLKYAGFDNVEVRTMPLEAKKHGKFLGKVFDGDAVYVARAQKVKAMNYDEELPDV